MLNPYEAPASDPSSGERMIVVVRRVTPGQLSIIWGGFFMFVAGLPFLFGGMEWQAALGALAIFAGIGFAQFTYWRVKEDRIRAASPRPGKKAALWGGLAWSTDHPWIWTRSGYLLLTVDSLVFTRHLDEVDQGVFISLDEIGGLKATAGRLTVWQADEKSRRVFIAGGSREWKALIEMACQARRKRRQAGV